MLRSPWCNEMPEDTSRYAHRPVEAVTKQSRPAGCPVSLPPTPAPVLPASTPAPGSASSRLTSLPCCATPPPTGAWWKMELPPAQAAGCPPLVAGTTAGQHAGRPAGGPLHPPNSPHLSPVRLNTGGISTRHALSTELRGQQEQTALPPAVVVVVASMCTIPLTSSSLTSSCPTAAAARASSTHRARVRCRMFGAPTCAGAGASAGREAVPAAKAAGRGVGGKPARQQLPHNCSPGAV